MGLADMKDLLYSCRECGNCGAGMLKPFQEGDINPADHGELRCLPYEKFKFVAYRPSGRIWLISRLYDGAVEITEDLVKVAFTDTTCGICDEICAPEFAPLFRALREEIMEKRPELIPIGVQKALENISASNNPFGLKIGERTAWARGLNLPEKGKTVYFAGCYASYRYPQISRAAIKLMRAAGSDVAYMGRKEICCGNQAYWSGNSRLAQQKGKAVVKALEEAGAKEVVFSCAEGYENFKHEYPRLWGKNLFRVVHITEWLKEKTDSGELGFSKKRDVGVTYHDPCRLGRYSRVFDAPRELLKNISGVRLSEKTKNPQWENCCGSGGGIVRNSYPAFASWAAKKRMEELKERSNRILTACPLCLEQLTDITGADPSMSVEDLICFLAEAL